VHKAKLDGERVCVKVLRVYQQDAGSAAKKVLSFRSFPETATESPGTADILQRSCRVEEVTTSQHCSFPWSS